MLIRLKTKTKTDSVARSIGPSIAQGITVQTNTMFGPPGETLKEVLESDWLIKHIAMAGAHGIQEWRSDMLAAKKLPRRRLDVRTSPKGGI
jgi:hypothetical protein